MRVSIDCRYIRERPSGIGTYMQALVDRLPGLAPDDSFHFWAHPLAGSLAQGRRNASETTVAAGANGPGTLLWPGRLVDLNSVDVLHEPFNLLGRGVRCRSVVTIHDLIWLLTPSQAEGLSPLTPAQALFYRDGILRALREATQLVAISRATADAIRLVTPEAGPRTHVIHHGVDADFRPPADRGAVRERLRAELGLGDFLLVIGQNTPSKNHGAVLDAFAAAGLDPSISLVFVQRLYATRGHPLAFHEPLDQRARDLGVADRVRFVSGLTREQVVALYQGAMGLIQYSRFEGFGMPTLEAIACGTPVLASDIAPLVEVLGGAALHASLRPLDLAAAMKRLAAEPSLREELSARGVERSLAFSWERCAREHLDIYREAAR